MLQYMLDTGTCSYAMKRLPSVVQRLANVPVGEVCISVITTSELLFGVEVSPRQPEDQATLTALLPYVEVLDFPVIACAHYASIRAELKVRGAMVGANDLFIAAHARSLGLTLITNNTREFRRVRNLAIDNWTTTA